MNEQTPQIEIPSRLSSLPNIPRKYEVSARIAGAALTLGGIAAVGVGVNELASDYSDANEPATIVHVVKEGDTMSGLVKEENPNADASDIAKITDDALSENKIGTSYGMQTGSEVKIPSYPEFAFKEAQSDK